MPRTWMDGLMRCQLNTLEAACAMCLHLTGSNQERHGLSELPAASAALKDGHRASEQGPHAQIKR